MGPRGKKCLLASLFLFGLALAVGWLVCGSLLPGSPEHPDEAANPENSGSPQVPAAPRLQAFDVGPEEVHSQSVNARSLLTLRDLATGGVIPGVNLAVSCSSRPPSEPSPEVLIRVEVTGAGGEFRLGPSEVPGFPPDASGWIAPPQSREELEATGTFWAYRQMQLSGAVRSADASSSLDLKSVRLTLVLAGKGLPDGGVGGQSSPGSREWLGRHGLGKWPRQLGSVDQAGRFTFTVPRLHSLAIVADAEGWRPASAPVATQGDAQEIDLALSTAIRISGLLRSHDGSPLVNARVVLYVTKTGAYDSIKPGGSLLLLQPRGGSTGEWDKEKGTSRVTLTSIATSDAAGRFSGYLRAEGTVRMLVYAGGHALSETALGLVDRDQDGLEVRVDRANEVGPILLRYGDRILGNFALLVSDLSTVEQPAIDYRTDAEGRLKSEWFVSGKLYALIPQDKAVPFSAWCNHYFRWQGETEIDLKSLPTRHP